MSKFISEQVNQIQELKSDVFFTYLDFPSLAFLKYLISPEFKYIWVVGYSIRDSRSFSKRKQEPWFNLNIPLTSAGSLKEVKVRNLGVQFDFIVTTAEFLRLMEDGELESVTGIRCMQVNKLPPDYFQFDKFQKKGLFEQLNKLDMNFFADFPGNDYGRLYCFNKKWLERVLSNESINWGDLP